MARANPAHDSEGGHVGYFRRLPHRQQLARRLVVRPTMAALFVSLCVIAKLSVPIAGNLDACSTPPEVLEDASSVAVARDTNRRSRCVAGRRMHSASLRF